MLAIVMDPDFQALVREDEEMVDSSRATMAAGWEEVYVDEGEIVNVVEGKSVYPPLQECLGLTDGSKGVGEQGDIAF
jgi:hypothetical protein